jgi:pimeloyl-ACP methyl ester carboxylesterase
MGATRYARNGDVEIAYEDLGGAGGDPLLLVMGLGVSRFWWQPGLVAELVGRGFHVVAYDQRDAGESTRFPDRDAVQPVPRSHEHRGRSPGARLRRCPASVRRTAQGRRGVIAARCARLLFDRRRRTSRADLGPDGGRTPLRVRVSAAPKAGSRR